MKSREFAAIIANIGAIAATLGQATESAQALDDKEVVTITVDSIMNMSGKLVIYCNKLGQLIPDVELEFDDASHRNDE